MAPNADFQFTEGHVRILLWMCDSHQEWIDNASAELMREYAIRRYRAKLQIDVDD